MPAQPTKILFAAGGTGGHLFPAIAIADEIRQIQPETEILFVGTKGKIEARVVPERGYEFTSIWISGLRRKAVFGNLLFPLKITVAIVQSFNLIRRFKPDVIVGTGGYVCGPVVSLGSHFGVPTLIQEQNSYPGITTRLLAPRASEVHVTFEITQKYLKRKDNVKRSGNPTRAVLGTVRRADAARYFDVDPKRKTLLVFGGSLGATSINNAVEIILHDLNTRGVQVIWQTGEIDYGRLCKYASTRIKVYKFIDRMENAYAACDLALCRSGATTVAELTQTGVPAVLVPYPYAAADHQTENAKALAEKEAAVMLRDDQLKDQLRTVLDELMNDPEKLSRMSERTRQLGTPDAAATLARAVLRLAGE